MIYDVVVLGLGGMGSATAAHAARRGLSVLGLEQYGPAHLLGASQGKTRLIRMAYFEGADYVPLLRRAYTLWDELEAQTGTWLRSRTGAVFVGKEQSSLIAGTRASALAHNLQIQEFTAAELAAAFPAIRPRADEVGIFEAAAGAVFPEAAVRAHLEVAKNYGATLRFDTLVREWDAQGASVRLHLADGTIANARNVVVCAGPWLQDLFSQMHVPIVIERNIQAWFAPEVPQDYAPDSFCAFALDRDGRFFYGFPDYGDGVKCAFHHSGQFTTVPSFDRAISPDDTTQLRQALHAFVPDAAGALLTASACMYSLTPDEHFVIGPHPSVPHVFIAGGFS
ncbi:MAG: N-methyl-L-tryptophan oxidase, partial [Candidatus Eremiobacteraeota bacterium]|nr:N-methyl-L-tryptophan oxidase [Candidatus Eremiobacteraeota bacterium]